MSVIVNLKHFPILRVLYGSGGKTRVLWRLILIFGILHVLGSAVALREGAFYVKEPLVATVGSPCPCDSTRAGMGEADITRGSTQAATVTMAGGEKNRGNRFVGYGEDLANHFYYVAFTISFFLVWGLIARFNQVFLGHHATSDALPPLIELGKLNPEDRYNYEKYVNEQVRLITLQSDKAKLLFVALWAFGVIGYLLLAVIYPIQSGQITGCKTWNFCFNHFPAMYYYGQFKDSLVNIIIGPSVLWVTVTITVAARRIVRFAAKEKLFHIVPLSPDGAGGLTPLGRLSLVLFYIVIVQLLYIVPTTLNLGFHIGYQILYPCFFAFAAFVFFWPLSAARLPMQTAKRQEMERLSQLVNRSYEQIRDNLKVDQTGRVVGLEKLEDFERLRQLYRDVRRMPVWPYDFTTLTRFSSIFAIPVIAFILQMLFSTDSIFYRPDQLNELLEKLSSWVGR
jgi:hypothetical protein